MRKIIKGLAFHCHHDILCEYVYDYEERVQFIKTRKLKSEQSLRLRLFKMIPDDRIPGRDSLEWQNWKKAEQNWKKMYLINEKTWQPHAKAEKICVRAWQDYIDKYGDEIKQLHKELCPDCPFDGKTIFSEGK